MNVTGASIKRFPLSGRLIEVPVIVLNYGEA